MSIRHSFSLLPRDGSIVALEAIIRATEEVFRLTKSGHLPSDEERRSACAPILKEMQSREAVLMAAPGFREFATWVNVKLGLQLYDPKALLEVKRELCRRLHCPFHEINGLTLVDAVAVLNQPEALAGRPAADKTLAIPGTEALTPTGLAPDGEGEKADPKPPVILGGPDDDVTVCSNISADQNEHFHVDPVVKAMVDIERAASTPESLTPATDWLVDLVQEATGVDHLAAIQFGFRRLTGEDHPEFGRTGNVIGWLHLARGIPPSRALKMTAAELLAEIRKALAERDRQSNPADPPPPAEPTPAGKALAGAGTRPLVPTPAFKAPAAPEDLDSRAVGFAHQAMNRGESINVSQIAKELGCERTKLYDLPGFRALVDKNRADRDAAKKSRPRGSKDRKTGNMEAWDDGG